MASVAGETFSARAIFKGAPKARCSCRLPVYLGDSGCADAAPHYPPSLFAQSLQRIGVRLVLWPLFGYVSACKRFDFSSYGLLNLGSVGRGALEPVVWLYLACVFWFNYRVRVKRVAVQKLLDGVVIIDYCGVEVSTLRKI